VADGCEAFDGLAGDALGGGIRSDELRVGGFKGFEFVHEAVVLTVADEGVVFDVVVVVVVAD